MVEDVANAQPSFQIMKISPSTSEQKEVSVSHDKGSFLGTKPSEGPSTTVGLLNSSIDTNDAHTHTHTHTHMDASFALFQRCWIW